MTATARWELVEALRQRYAAATREDKVRILTEFAAVSGLHRKPAICVLKAESKLVPAKRRGRPCVYDQAVQQGLVTLWEASDRVCGKRLRPLLPLLLGALELHGHIKLDASARQRSTGCWCRHARWPAGRGHGGSLRVPGSKCRCGPSPSGVTRESAR